MSYFELCLKFEKMIKKGIDISTLSEFQTFAKTYPHTAKKLLLEAEIIKLKQSIKDKGVREKFLTRMKIGKLKGERTRLLLKEKAYWNYRIESTKYSIFKLKISTVSTIKGVTSLIVSSMTSLILGTKQRVKNALPLSLSYAGTWALTSRHITEWNRNRVYSTLEKCREKARSHRKRYFKLYAKLRGGSP